MERTLDRWTNTHRMKYGVTEHGVAGANGAEALEGNMEASHSHPGTRATSARKELAKN